MQNPRSSLRYVEADDLESSTIDFDELELENAAGDTLGDVEGFILDSSTGQPYYVVVDSKGWFKTGNYLLPIGHVRFDASRQVLIADLTSDSIRNFPEFDLDTFSRWSADETERFSRQTTDVCCAGRAGASNAPGAWHTQSHYQQPNWWDRNSYRPGAERSGAASGAMISDRSRDAETPDRESIVAQADDTSPHLGGRAQAGDVIGVETGGERTYLGDTTEDENKRRRDAEKAARKNEK